MSLADFYHGLGQLETGTKIKGTRSIICTSGCRLSDTLNSVVKVNIYRCVVQALLDLQDVFVNARSSSGYSADSVKRYATVLSRLNFAHGC